MAVKNLTFLKPVGGSISTRDRELNRADVKSHASKYAHQRLRALGRQGKPIRLIAATGNDEEGARHEHVPHPDPTPLTIVRLGNSDPFAASTVQITPRISEIINFFSTYYVPIAEPRFFLTSSKDIANKTIVHALQHETSARAFISHLVTLMANISSGDRVLQRGQLQTRNRAISSLRSNIQLADSGSDAVPTAMKFMFMEASFNGNLAEARIHGSMLGNVLYQTWRSDRSTLDLALLIHVIYVDGQLAVKHLRRTIFDMDWVEEVLTPGLQLINQWLEPHLPSIIGPLASFINDSVLRRWLIEYRKAAFCLTFDVSTLPSGQGQLLMFFVSLRAATVSGHLANHYQHLQRMLDQNLSIQDRYVQLTYSALVLALLEYCNKPESMQFYKRSTSTKPDNDDLVLVVLRRTLSQIRLIKPTPPPELTIMYNKFHLWCLFVGAQAEQHAVRQGKSGGRRHMFQQQYSGTEVALHSQMEYFNHFFAELTCQMGLYTWPAIRAVLESVLYFDTFLPHGKEWVEDTILQYLRNSTYSTPDTQREYGQEDEEWPA